MLGYDVIKWIHIISAAVFFATGIGTALGMWFTYRGGDVQAIASMARKVVRVDLAFTATSGLVLPITGALLMWSAGFSPDVPWLIASYILYVITFACWILATRLRIKVRDTVTAAARKGEALPDCYYRYMRWWFQLSWPAFIALLVVFYLMMAQPQAGAMGVTGIPAL